MNGMAKKRDKRVGKGESEVRIPPAEVSYMRDWRLTWWPVCDSSAVTERRNARTRLQARINIGHRFPIVKEFPRTNNPTTSTVPGHPEGVLYAVQLQ
jgi:hypothetical protein